MLNLSSISQQLTQTPLHLEYAIFVLLSTPKHFAQMMLYTGFPNWPNKQSLFIKKAILTMPLLTIRGNLTYKSLT